MMTRVDEGRELAKLRERAGLKGREVGAALDVDKSAVSQWENGKAKPTLDKLAALDALYGGTGEVWAIYGLTRSAPSAEEVLAEVRAMVAGLSERMEQLTRQVASLLVAAEQRVDQDPQAHRQAD